jgi:uncharacterized protein (TIGR02444 family)
MTRENKDSLTLGGPLWQFATEFYGRSGVANACLLLQDELNVDVVVLLTALFAHVKGEFLAIEDVRVADSVIAQWRSKVVLPLRRLRRWLKCEPTPALSGATSNLRLAVKECELIAEQIELAILAGWLDRRDRSSSLQGCAASGALNAVVRYYAGRTSSLYEQLPLREAVATIERTVAQYSEASH